MMKKDRGGHTERQRERQAEGGEQGKVTHLLAHSLVPRQRDQLSGFRTTASYLLLLRAGKAGGWQRHSVCTHLGSAPPPLLGHSP